MFGDNVSNTSNTIIVGTIAMLILCASAAAVIATNSNSNNISADEIDFYAGYEDGYAAAVFGNSYRLADACDVEGVYYTGEIVAVANQVNDEDNSLYEYANSPRKQLLIEAPKVAATEELLQVEKIYGEARADVAFAEGVADEKDSRSEAYSYGYKLGYMDGQSLDLNEHKDFDLFKNRSKMLREEVATIEIAEAVCCE